MFAVCAALLISQMPDEFSVVGALGALIVVCAQVAFPRILDIVVLVGYVVAACVWVPFLGFLPVIAYVAMHRRSWGIRLLWAVPLFCSAIGICGPVSISYLIGLCLACMAAVVLAIRDVRYAAERIGIIRTYDEMREQIIAHEVQDAGDERSAKGTSASMSERTDLEALNAAPNQAPDPLAGLTKREEAVASLVAEGLDNRQIASALFLSEGTVRNHISTILKKTNLQNRTQLAVLVLRQY